MSWGRGQTATYWPKVPLTIAALHSHSGWAAQPWATEGRKVILLLASCPPTDSNCNWDSNWLTQAVCGTWLYNCLTSTCFLWACASAPNSTMSTGQGDIPISSTGCTCFHCSSAYLHRCISWLTARSRVNMLHKFLSRQQIFIYKYKGVNSTPVNFYPFIYPAKILFTQTPGFVWNTL